MKLSDNLGMTSSTKNVFYLHLTLLPYLSTSDEIKTKPTQHSVQALRGMGIQPDSIICRSEKDIEDSVREKISLYCDVQPDSVISLEILRVCMIFLFILRNKV